MSKLEFKPEDFDWQKIYKTPAGYYDIERKEILFNAIQATHFANARLAEMFAAAPVVYGRLDPQDGKLKFINDPSVVSKTHSARLVCIEELKDE